MHYTNPRTHSFTHCSNSWQTHSAYSSSLRTTVAVTFDTELNITVRKKTPDRRLVKRWRCKLVFLIASYIYIYVYTYIYIYIHGGPKSYIFQHTISLEPLGTLVKGIPHSINELIPVLGSQLAGDMSHKPGSRLPLLYARPAVNPTTLKRAATNFAAWWKEARWVWTVCLRLLPTSWLWFEPRPFCAWVQHANHSATEPTIWYFGI